MAGGIEILMAAARKKNQATRWYDGETPFEELDPAAQVAHEIVKTYRDLAPSVERIMSAELTETQREHALGLFQASLGELGDPHRDPRHAIDVALTAVD